MSALLDVKDLVVKYGAIEALHGVSLTVKKGEIVSLIGCNGAGKSTTLRAISGIRRAASGNIVYAGSEISRLPAHTIVRSGLVQSPEGRGVFPNMTVAENLDLGAFIRKDHAEIGKDLERALGLFPRLRERMGQMAGTLSGGEQQMLAMARALLTRPTLLLLDEPSLGLAPQIVQTIFKIIREINASGTTILLVEQNARMALNVSHRAYVLETGKIVNEGDAKALAQSDAVRKAYLGH